VLVALGDILYWAVSAEAEGVDINLFGLILLIVGIIGLILTLFLTAGPLILTRRTSPSSSAERRLGPSAETSALHQDQIHQSEDEQDTGMTVPGAEELLLEWGEAFVAGEGAEQ
jgi:hypothetical protein